MAKTQKAKKKEKKNIASGIVHIQATFNNTIVTITDRQGNAISWSSAGSLDFRGAKKSTPFAAQITAEDAARKAMEHTTPPFPAPVSGLTFRDATFGNRFQAE